MIRIGTTKYAFSGSARIIGIASSEVAKYTAINVPTVIILLLYNAVAITENQHCGSKAKIEPNIGQYLPDIFSFLFIVFPNLDSIY